MELTTEKLLQDMLANLTQLNYIEPETIPNIDLYMDQVTTFMNQHLAGSKRYEEDKILTKTMINNYAKNHLLPPPSKKRYSKEHMLILIFIYYFKNLISIHDIEQILTPIADSYFPTETASLPLEDVYNQIFSLAPAQKERIKQEITYQYQAAKELFSDIPEEEKETLQNFAFICELSHDVYLKKMLIEKLVDDMQQDSLSKKNK